MENRSEASPRRGVAHVEDVETSETPTRGVRIEADPPELGVNQEFERWARWLDVELDARLRHAFRAGFMFAAWGDRPWAVGDEG